MAKKILLIEDEQIIVDLLQRKLTEEGYNIVLAKNGEEGIKVMKAEKPVSYSS